MTEQRLRDELQRLHVPQANDQDTDVYELACNVMRAMAIAYLQVCNMLEMYTGATMPGKDPLVDYAQGIQREVVQDKEGREFTIEDRRIADTARDALMNKQWANLNRADKRRAQKRRNSR